MKLLFRLKQLILLLQLLILITSCNKNISVSSSKDKDGSKMLIGNISQSDLRSDTDFPWFNKTYNEYQPDSNSLETIKLFSAHVKIIVFGGTWCSDTQNLLPKFYKTIDLAGFKSTQIQLIAVSRSKKSADGLTDIYKIINVPTFIILYDGKETGRITESVKQSIEKDMQEILQSTE